MLAKLSPHRFSHTPLDATDKVWRHIPGSATWIDPRSEASSTGEEDESTFEGNTKRALRQIREYLDDFDDYEGVHPNAVPEKTLMKWGRLFDIVLPSSQ
ncbi:hypothetical protein C0991_000602, partial [Blastosporella zonata]